MRTARPVYPLLLATFSALAAVGCGSSVSSDARESDELRGPGNKATDARVPELGDDLNVLRQSKIKMADALAQSKNVIEAKFELNGDHKLALSLYPLDKPLSVDAEHQVFQELAGDPTIAPFSGNTEKFADQEHLTRSARDLTLVQLSRIGLGDAVNRVAPKGFVFWAIPTVRDGRAGYGVYTANGNTSHYEFIDGDGSRESRVTDLGYGPGPLATDPRVPELGDDLSVLLQSKISMADALAASERENGPAIEAKFELGGDKKLSLSIYPVKDISLDAERNTFVEQAGDPTGLPFKSELSEFKVPDVEHLTRSSRDLTLVQTAGRTLRQAVDAAQAAIPGGFVYWTIPTIRNTRSGYGVYVYGPRGDVHYLFIS
jgi:hypothetical protein